MQNAQSIFEFGDYRAFLWSHVRRQKEQKPDWTLGQWAKRIGFSSTSSLTKVLNGDRELGPKAQQKIVRYFTFSKAESEQFAMLVALAKGQTRLGSGPLSRIVANRYRTMSLEEFKSLSDPDAFVLRETLKLSPSATPEELIRKLRRPKSRRDTEKLLETLKSLSLVEEPRPGYFSYKDGHVTTSSDLASEAIRQYHEQCLGRIKEDVRNVAVEYRELQATTFCIDVCDLQRAKEKIRKFRQDFAREFENAKGNAVYQLHLSFIPQTKLTSVTKETSK